MLYTFGVKVLVCDDFCVPTDVTYAWMGASGLTLELFAYLIATLWIQSDAGFGTKVGGAVFNVSFIIGCCAIFRPGHLSVAWSPFARFALYYATCLCMLGILKEMWWYESLAFFSLFIGYSYVLLVMKQNDPPYRWFEKEFAIKVELKIK